MAPCGLGFLSAGLKNAHGRIAIQTKGKERTRQLSSQSGPQPPHGSLPREAHSCGLGETGNAREKMKRAQGPGVQGCTC